MAKTLSKQKDYFSSREAAEILHVAVSTIQLWTNNGLLRAWKTVGGHRRISKDSVEEMLIQQKINTGTKNAAQSISIVVVEDNIQEMMLYKKQIEMWDMNADVHICKDGYAGLLTIGKTLPNIIITDLMMPNMNGFEMIKVIQENLDLEHCLIIAVSALTKDEIKIRGGLPDNVIVFSKPAI